MSLTYKIVPWQQSRTARGVSFYPVTKYVGQVFNADGRFIGETGKCERRVSCLRAIEKLMAKLESEA